MKSIILAIALFVSCNTANSQTVTTEQVNRAFNMTQSPDARTVQEGINLLLRYAKGGDTTCMWNLAQFYLYKKGEYKDAAYWYKRFYETSNDSQFKSFACQKLGQIYSGAPYLETCDEYGVSTRNLIDAHGPITPNRMVNIDLDEALKWYNRAQSLGCDVSKEMANVNDRKVNGDKKRLEKLIDALYFKASCNKPIDSQDGFQKLLEFAKNGNGKAEGLIGSCFLQGYGTNQSIKDAVYWTKRGADHGDTYAISEMGIYYLEGLGVERNEQEYVRLETIAANRGFANGCYSLGVYYDQYKSNIPEMIKWYMKACESNHGLAFYNLATYYIKNRQADKALDLLLQADTLENEQKLYPSIHIPGAYQNMIGNIYGFGDYYPVKKDLKKAKYWYEKAVKKGHAKAAMNMRDLGL
jgi:TPR repeat protein